MRTRYEYYGGRWVVKKFGSGSSAVYDPRIASSGQTSAQLPQSVQRSEVIMYFPLPSSIMASMGHALARPSSMIGWNYVALWRTIFICFENSSKSLSVANIENLFLFAMAQIKKSVFEPCIPFDRQRLKYFAAVT